MAAAEAAHAHEGALRFRDLEELSEQKRSGQISGAHVLQGTVMQSCGHTMQDHQRSYSQQQGSQYGSTGGAVPSLQR